MQKLKAVIEFGSNKWRVAVNNSHGEMVFFKSHLSKENIVDSQIGEAYLFACLNDFSEELQKHGLDIKNRDDVRAIATEGFRSDKSANEIVGKVRQEMGVEIEIISPRREAELSAKAMIPENSSQNALIIDMGGGSTDIALYSGEDREVIGTVSLIGSKFLLDKASVIGINTNKVFRKEEGKIHRSIEEFKEKTHFDFYEDDLEIITNTSAIMKIISIEKKQKDFILQDMVGKEEKAVDLMLAMEKVFSTKPQEVFELGYSGYKTIPQTITGAFILKETLSAFSLDKNQKIKFSLKSPKDGLITEMFAQEQVEKNQENFAKVSSLKNKINRKKTGSLVSQKEKRKIISKIIFQKKGSSR